MSLLEVALYVLVAFTGTVLVFSKRTINQVFVYSAFGVSMAVLFFVLHAPDVALSELTVGSIILPIMLLVTLMKTGNQP